jgi:hypothetical protein
MLNLFSKVALFVTSFYPLAWVYFLMLFPKQQTLAFVLIVTTSIFVLVAAGVIRVIERTAPEKIKVCSIDLKNDATTSYLISYVLPFMALPIDGAWNQVAAFCVFFFILGYLYINSNMIFINPLLSLVGFHVLHVTNDKEDVYVVLTCEELRKGMTIDAISIGNRMYYCKGIGKGNSK